MDSTSLPTVFGDWALQVFAKTNDVYDTSGSHGRDSAIPCAYRSRHQCAEGKVVAGVDGGDFVGGSCLVVWLPFASSEAPVADPEPPLQRTPGSDDDRVG